MPSEDQDKWVCKSSTNYVTCYLPFLLQDYFQTLLPASLTLSHSFIYNCRICWLLMRMRNTRGLQAFIPGELDGWSGRKGIDTAFAILEITEMRK